MSHVTNMNESCHICVNSQCLKDLRKSCNTLQQSCASKSSQISRVTYENVMAHMSEECQYESVMENTSESWHIWMAHLTYHLRMRTFRNIPRNKRGMSHASFVSKKKSLASIGSLVDSGSTAGHNSEKQQWKENSTYCNHCNTKKIVHIATTAIQCHRYTQGRSTQYEWHENLQDHLCGGLHYNTLQHTAMHWNTLHHTATHCNTLQHTATHGNTRQHTATQYSILQHTATHSKLTATHCNT